MQIITFFAPKGGTGRATALMALAARMVAGSARISVLELSQTVGPCENRFPSTLKPFEEVIANTPVGYGTMTVTQVHDNDSLLEALREAEFDDVDYVLVDTPGRPNDTALVVLGISDLVVVPATGAMEAAFASDWLTNNRLWRKSAYGLVTGVIDQDEADLTRAAFHGIPVLRTGLPYCDLFRRQRTEKHMHDMAFPNSPDIDYSEGMAMARAHDLSMELEKLLTNSRAAKRYTINEPLATDDAMAHLRVLLERNPALMQ